MRQMSNEIEQKIKQLINETKELTKPADGKLNNYPGVVQGVLQSELLHEIKILEAMLQYTAGNPDAFAEEFKERSGKRARNRDKYVSLSAMPESPANQLYWNIAELVFAPKTMHDMLAILLPEVKYQVKFSDVLPVAVYKNKIDQYKETMRQQLTHVVRQKLELDQVPDIANMAHYVITRNEIFDVRDCVYLTLPYHEELEQVLAGNFPAIHKKLYQHNPNLKLLAEDIKLYRRDAITPRDAIKQLIAKLKSGNTIITGSTYVSALGQTAAERFYDYLNELSDETRNQLYLLQSDRKENKSTVTLEYVVNAMMKDKGVCVDS